MRLYCGRDGYDNSYMSCRSAAWYDLAHSYVNVRHKLYTPRLGAPMGGLLSAFYAILCCRRRDATAFTPMLRELALPCAVCRYVDDVYVAIYIILCCHSLCQR